MNQHHGHRNVLLGCLAAAALAVLGTCVVGTGAVWLLARVASRIQIQIDPAAVQKAVIDATFEHGDAEQKLVVIRALPDMPNAQDYLSHLIAAVDDPDPEVRDAAAAALRAIDPDVADLAGVP